MLVAVGEAVAPADAAVVEAPDVDVDPPFEGMDDEPATEHAYEEIPHEGVATGLLDSGRLDGLDSGSVCI